MIYILKLFKELCFLYHLLPYLKIFDPNTVPTYYHLELSFRFISSDGGVSLQLIMYEGFYLLGTFSLFQDPSRFMSLKVSQQLLSDFAYVFQRIIFL